MICAEVGLGRWWGQSRRELASPMPARRCAGARTVRHELRAEDALRWLAGGAAVNSGAWDCTDKDSHKRALRPL